MRAEHRSGRKLEVQWRSEEWIPAIRIVVGQRKSAMRLALRGEALRPGNFVRSRRNGSPAPGAGRPGASNRLSGLSGLNSSRITWR